MKASAPGKLVLSGAYCILTGAPALVTAVDRRVVVDSERPACFEAPEVSEGMSLLMQTGPVGSRPWYDSTELRGKAQKLGLGSSAAICVASLAVLLAEQKLRRGDAVALSTLLADLYPLALLAHRRAQGGGSGVDVAAACFGGTLRAQRQAVQDVADNLEVEALSLPEGLVIEIWASPDAASTPKLVQKVFASEKTAPSPFRLAMRQQGDASEAALLSLRSGDSSSLVKALRRQHQALRELGQVARAPIVLPAVSHLHAVLPEDACFLPSGAGGGDVSLYISGRPSDPHFRRLAASYHMRAESLSLGAPGLTIESIS